MHSDVEQEGLYQNCKFGEAFLLYITMHLVSLRQASTKIVNLVIPGVGVLTPGWGQTWYIVYICVKHLKNIFFNAYILRVN